MPNKITSMMNEKRVFLPPKDLSRGAYIKSMEEYEELYEQSINQPEENGLDLKFFIGPKQGGPGKPKFRRHGEDQEGSFQESMAGQYPEGYYFEA